MYFFFCIMNIYGYHLICIFMNISKYFRKGRKIMDNIRRYNSYMGCLLIYSSLNVIK